MRWRAWNPLSCDSCAWPKVHSYASPSTTSPTQPSWLQATQQTMLRFIADIQSNVVAAMHASESRDWTTLATFDEPLPYGLGSLPWKRLLDDWVQGDASKVGPLMRWLAVALNPTYRETLPPLELQCLEPMVLEGFLGLVVPVLQLQRNILVQTKPMDATLLRSEVHQTTGSFARRR
ncbi:Aste57867_13771 [Aphanomyces stellatus]|uniref:Aste57867_13771 protein n=1 Tax=Aphanomyces stellatus TaxID=120398 RepID=A0A485L0P1_9STRA|nr:hypothetical protein As57867_013721 [Aphanomyces stellatus]VFT90604.1 Aste57867_13771 [Aphanomyces stellatus]